MTIYHNWNRDSLLNQTHTTSNLTWQEFVELVDVICSLKGWELEFGEVGDESFAVFGSETVSCQHQCKVFIALKVTSKG